MRSGEVPHDIRDLFNWMIRKVFDIDQSEWQVESYIAAMFKDDNDAVIDREFKEAFNGAINLRQRTM